ncbi:hypothetical protein [Streptomyces ochraceiscleroticus]|uniref:Uncharacterized protein n=1 Tax=Streptomyces ochraceiscleroticus TaxID=47761 RepID=A0ABW1MGC3_9ACTN|nr:hypothetical protein [Streptomyces ochraceiscleroticus]
MAARLGSLLSALSQAVTVLSYAAGVPVVRLLHSDAADEEPAATLNPARALTRAGRPGVREAHAANQRFVASSPRRDHYAPLIRRSTRRCASSARPRCPQVPGPDDGTSPAVRMPPGI